jgi:hypothetical protein
VHNEKLQRIVLIELQAAGKKGGLQGIEIIDGVVMVDEEWTPQNVSLLSSLYIIVSSSSVVTWE